MSEETVKKAYAFMVKCYCEKRGYEVTNIEIVKRDEKDCSPACRTSEAYGQQSAILTP